MKNILPHWGTEATTSVDDIRANPSYWKDVLYDRKVLVFRGLPDLSMDELWDLHTVFGTPWTEPEYRRSLEGVTCQTPGKYVTAYGNVTAARSIGNKPMPWHRDIPWHRESRYPIRSLYPVRLENGVATNTTRFCDANYAWNRMTPERQAQIGEIQLRIQNWYQVVCDLVPSARDIPLVERHRYTGRWSLLLNSFGYNRPDLSFSTARTGTWITDTLVDGLPGGLEVLEELHRLACVPENIYEHEWRRGDLMLFDNYSGVFHNRGRVVAEDPARPVVREFWRMNVKHAWQT